MDNTLKRIRKCVMLTEAHTCPQNRQSWIVKLILFSHHRYIYIIYVISVWKLTSFTMFLFFVLDTYERLSPGSELVTYPENNIMHSSPWEQAIVMRLANKMTTILYAMLFECKELYPDLIQVSNLWTEVCKIQLKLSNGKKYQGCGI